MSQCSIAPGEIVALAGLSGSGKSTLALSLLRLLHYRGGEVTGSIRLAGRELSGLERARNARRAGQIDRLCAAEPGRRPQRPAAGADAARTKPGARIRGACARGFVREAARKRAAALRRDFLDKRAGELSTGQGQRLLIALAIMHDPPVLLADEPTSALDVITQAAVLELFQDLNRRNGTAMLFISHDLLSVASIGHRVRFCMKAGSWSRARRRRFSARRSIRSRRSW